MATKAANARRTTKRPKLRAISFDDPSPEFLARVKNSPSPSKADAANAYATIAARMCGDRSTLYTTAWTPEREYVLEMIAERLERIHTATLLEMLSAIQDIARNADNA